MDVEMFHDQVSTKECAGRGDRTRGRLHAKGIHFRSSYRARLLIEEVLYYTLCHICHRMTKPTK